MHVSQNFTLSFVSRCETSSVLPSPSMHFLSLVEPDKKKDFIQLQQLEKDNSTFVKSNKNVHDLGQSNEMN